jgi:pyrroline-5-carboxylate reductase
MATALCRGIVGAGLIEPRAIIAGDPDEGQRRRFERETGAGTTAHNPEACRAAVVVMAVKPQVLPAVLEEVGPLFGTETLVVTIAAGAPCRRIEAASPRPIRVVRAMPNTPMLVGEGAAALCKGAHATDADLERIHQLFASCALVLDVAEEQMHAVTALSGSGPAYVFYLAEAMARAGAAMGLSERDAAALTEKTLLGAARMLAETDEPPAELRRRVTSPGGTTEAAVRSMDEAAVSDAVVAAIEAACARSRELGAEKG